MFLRSAATDAMSLKRIKRRLSLTFRGSRGVDESLSELAEHLTIEENGGIKENGKYKCQSTEPQQMLTKIDTRVVTQTSSFKNALSQRGCNTVHNALTETSKGLCKRQSSVPMLGTNHSIS